MSGFRLPTDGNGNAVDAYVEGPLDIFTTMVAAPDTPIVPAAYVWPLGARVLTLEMESTEPGDVKLGRAGQPAATAWFHILPRGSAGFLPIAAMEKAAKALRATAVAGAPAIQIGVWG